MAESMIKRPFNNISYTSGIFTPESGVTVHDQRFDKIGNLCILLLRVSLSDAFTEYRMQIGTLNEGFRPTFSVMRFVSSSGPEYEGYLKNSVNGFILKNGQVYIDHCGGGEVREVNLNSMWVTD